MKRYRCSSWQEPTTTFQNDVQFGGTFEYVIDAESDNGDRLLLLDPDRILTTRARMRLRQLVLKALNDAGYEPQYPEE